MPDDKNPQDDKRKDLSKEDKDFVNKIERQASEAIAFDEELLDILTLVERHLKVLALTFSRTAVANNHLEQGEVDLIYDEVGEKPDSPEQPDE